MRYVVAIMAGAFVALLPALFLLSPEFALLDACARFESWSFWPTPHDVTRAVTKLVTEVPCPAGPGGEADTDLPWLTRAAVMLAFCLGGRLAAHIAENRR